VECSYLDFIIRSQDVLWDDGQN